MQGWKKGLFEWCARVLLVVAAIGFSLLVIELLLEKCFGSIIRQKVNPEPYAFKIDDHGFRINSKDRIYSAAAGEYFRIICLGDSFTFGHGVSDEETYPFLLQQRLNIFFRDKIQVINAGVCGATIDAELEMYADKCIDFQHRLVLLLYHPADKEQLVKRELKDDIIDKLEHNISGKIRDTKIMQLVFYLHEKWKWRMVGKKLRAKSQDYVYDKYFGYLKELDRRVRLGNARLALVFYHPEERIVNFCLHNGIPVIDITREYNQQKRTENLLLVYHHNKRGNEFLAEQIGDGLINAGLLDGIGTNDIHIGKNLCLTAKRSRN